ncbi:MAG TPA: bifunctional adenosylcobinamide kinase/adenosylcobinamide-phosphate guanylyltransferase [Acidimicrobiales bacterium]
MITLVLGGARSGKSQVGERVAAGLPGPVTYVATTVAADTEMAERVAVHRARRPASWSTVEVGRGEDLGAALRALPGTALVDSLGAWLGGVPSFTADGERLRDDIAARAGDTVVVSDEVGLGVHPSSEMGRQFRDELGALNQVVAAAADEVLLVVAGRVLPLERA